MKHLIKIYHENGDTELKEFYQTDLLIATIIQLTKSNIKFELYSTKLIEDLS